jgi:hypothetical protein
MGADATYHICREVYCIMTPPIRISNSEISCFKDCRRKWWLSYYRGLKRKERRFSGPLALGSRVHRALELFYNDSSRPLLGYWGELIATDRTLLEAAFRDSTDFDNEAELGRIMLEGYLDWNLEEGIDSDLEIVSNEQRLITPMLNGEVELQAKIDQRVRRKIDGVRLFRDWKTTANFTDLTKTAQLNEQFLTYMVIEATQRDEAERCEGALVTMLKKVKRTASARPPFYDQLEIRHNVFTLRNFWTRLNGELTDMMRIRKQLDDGVDHQLIAYPRPSRDCSWKCEFAGICPLFDDGSAVEQAIDELYQVGNPYDYYDDPTA